MPNTNAKATLIDTKFVKTCSWKVDENATTEHTTVLTFDFENVSVQRVLAECVRNLVIKTQIKMRKHPEEWAGSKYTIKMDDMLSGRGSGVVATFENARATLNAVSIEDRNAIVDEILAQRAQAVEDAEEAAAADEK